MIIADELFKCVFDHFVGLALKGLRAPNLKNISQRLLLPLVV